MKRTKRETKTTRAVTFLALVEAEWFVYLLVPLLATEDATCLVLVASECGQYKLRRQLMLGDASSLRHSSIEDLVLFAVERGWWKYASILQRECRRAAPLQRFRRIPFEAGDPIDACYFAEWLWIQHQYPLRLPPVVMYAAAERGIPLEIMQLNERVFYDPLQAVKCATSHINIVRFLVRNKKMTLTIHENRPFEATSWSDGHRTYCVVTGIGWLTPRKGITGMYPLMDWAAEIGDFDLVKTLYIQPGGKRLCTSKALEFAAIRGDLEMVKWLFTCLFPTFYGVPLVLKMAATHGHVDIIKWLCNERESVEKFPMGTIENAVKGGNYETVRWLFENYDDKFPRTEALMYQAVLSGSIDIVRFLRDVVQCPLRPTAISYACGQGFLELLKWFQVQEPGWPWAVMSHSLIAKAASSGNLSIVKWIVENFDGWNVKAVKYALKGYHQDVLEYLYVKAQDRATAKGIPLQDAIYWPNRRRLLEKIFPVGGVEAVLWVLEHFPERNSGYDSVRFAVRFLKEQLPHLSGWWGLVRAFMRHRPMFARSIVRLPRWVARYGVLDDFKRLEELKHPRLFTKATLDCIIKYSQDRHSMVWFLTQCYEPTWFDLRLVSWAAKYTSPQLLSRLKETILKVSELSSDGATNTEVREFVSVVLWSAIRHDRVSILMWVCSQNFPLSVMDPLLGSRVLILAAKSGHWRTLLWLRENRIVDRDQWNQLAGIAARYGQLQCLRHLKVKWEVKFVLEDALQAGRRGHVDIIDYVLQDQPDLLDGNETIAREIKDLRHPYQCIMGFGDGWNGK